MAHTLTTALPLDPTAYLNGLRLFERAAQRTIEAIHEAFSDLGEALGRVAEVSGRAFPADPMAYTTGAAHGMGRPAAVQTHVRDLDPAAPTRPERVADGPSRPTAANAGDGVPGKAGLAWGARELEQADRLREEALAGLRLADALTGLDLGGTLESAALHRGELDREHDSSPGQQGEASASRVAGLLAEVGNLYHAAEEGLVITASTAGASERVDELGAAIEALHDKAVTITTRHMEAHASGGWAGVTGLGTDTVPAMLTPGEYVVNRRAAQMWAPLLAAINAGAFPARMHRGGPVFAAREAGGGPVTNHYGPVNQHFSAPIDRHTIRSVIIPEIERARARGKV